MNRNRNVCHSCRNPGHWFEDCPFKQQCPDCKNGFLKWFEVYRAKNVGKRFFSCTSGCGYFEWENNVKTNSNCDEGESSGLSSNRNGGTDQTVELSDIFKMLATITEEKDVKISVNITLEKGNCGSEDKGKGKM